MTSESGVAQTQEIDALRAKLAEAEDMLRAIRAGEVDAIVVGGNNGPAVYTLKGAADPYRLLVEQMSEGALTISPDGVILYCNAAFAGMIGRPREQLVGALIADHVLSCDATWLTNLLNRTSTEGRAVRLKGCDGMTLHTQFSSAPMTIEGELVHCVVVTDLSRQELRVLHEAIVNASADAIYALQLDGAIKSWNAGAERLYGYSAHEAIGRNIRMVIPAEHHQDADDVFQRLSNGQHQRLEVACVTKTGRSVNIALNLSPILGADGRMSAVAVIARDVTERILYEEQIRNLMHEVNHRAKNLLTVAQSITRLMTKEMDAAVFAEVLEERIAALAASQDLLTKSNWTGVELSELVRSQLSHYAHLLGARIKIDGPALRLNSSAAQNLGMAIHELSTNAAKYGSLSNDSGIVRISWAVLDKDRGQQVQLKWSEEGGPPLSPPTHRGFGHTVIVSMAKRSLDADVALEFRREGLVWIFTAPIAKIIESGAESWLARFGTRR